MSVCAYKEVFLLLLSRLKVTESGLQTDFRNPMQLVSFLGVPTVFACQLNSVLSFENNLHYFTYAFNDIRSTHLIFCCQFKKYSSLDYRKY